MTNEQSFETITLDNGETLEIHDNSRMISTDAWLVKLVFRIEIDMTQKDFNKIPGLTDKQIIEKIGKTVVYEVIRERNFIMNPDKETVFAEIRDSFLSMNMKYLSHPDFAVKYAFKIYNEKNRY